MNYLKTFATPQLECIHRGKVRDSYRIDDKRRMIVVTDRISAFDSVLENAVPFKGAVLNGISNYWFEKTKDIIDNHIIESVDPNINIVHEAQPIRVEVIVRGYLTGSMWRGYQSGKRTFSGVSVSDGLKKNEKFPSPIVTPTTKEDSDREITPDEIVAEGLVGKDLYAQMESVALKLFERGETHLREKGIILVDTKYEFGLLDGRLILIDEIHTPDSSRFWKREDYEKNPDTVEQMDKEFVRQWLISNKTETGYPTRLADMVVYETSNRYVDIYEIVTGQRFDRTAFNFLRERITASLVSAGLMKDGYVAIVMGSAADVKHAQKMKDIIDLYSVHCFYRVISAHKNGERIPEFADTVNNSIEPGVVIAVAGRSNGLGGALAANLSVPVISCPPFKDSADIMVNVHSSLMMPSKTPALTVVYPDNAAHAALRSLGMTRVREILNDDIKKMKEDLIQDDRDINR
ncbi:MAG: phosphoribosylaminoimidazolesuccinocarboxamide synthase [Spirochaetota bacterium]